MKPSLLVWSLLSLLTVPTLAVPSEDSIHAVSNPSPRLVKREEVAAPAHKDGQADSDAPGTVFNGVKVPPMKELTPEDFDETIKDGYWLVKHYSPSCPHCQQIAPTWQTLYEFYYTSDPLSTSTAKSADTHSSLNSFHGFYNFHFASINCLSYGDFCTKRLNIREWPTFNLYHNGEFVEQYAGKKTIDGLSQYIEEKLELIRPGSRPRKGVKLPPPGAKSVDTKAEPDKPAAKDKDREAGVKAGEKHNEQAAHLASKTAADKSTTAKKDPKPTVIPNPQGVSVPLTAESFQKLVTTTRDPWFVKFYAPWCSHCQALAPNWLAMAKEMKGVLNVGEVNCDAEPRLCKDARIKGFPTMYFFRGGERVEYDGLRGLGDLVNYAKKAVDVGSGVQYVDAATFKELEEKEEVIFLYLYDHATTSEDFAALERLTLSLVGHARLVKSNDTALSERFKVSTWPRLLVSRDGRPSYYSALAPKDTRDFRQVLSWMQTVWLPIVPELTASNAREIMDGKYVVLGILSRKRADEFILDKRELKNAALEWMDKQTHLFQLERQELRDAKQLRIEEADDRNDQRALRAAKSMRITIRENDKKQVGFAWVDGDFWERWLRTTYGVDVKNGERVIINDQDNRRYWDTAASGSPILPSRTSILETIPLVIASPPKIKSKSTIGLFEAVFFHTRSFLFVHPWITLSILAVSLLVSVYLARGKLIKRGLAGPGGILGGGSGGFFHLDGKEGLLNGGSTGKVD
ncbi:hypothetical protein DTO271D3_2777 [Paecilomyces variotii]|nr:hypothetical protein DTO212C5_3522 [Paecilomyces variotii]KAJ9317038.1 hypothetical protein DTO271D3_2777 [Paecilomyces variotii]